MSAIGDLDHLMILVADLDAADRALLALGFRPTPRGTHSADWGTANATVPLADGTYLETLGVLAPTPANEGQRARLGATGPGPYGVAFKAEDAAAAAAAFEAAGLGAGGARAFGRPVAVPGGGEREARFEVARTRPGATPGAWLFAVRHATPELVWRPDRLQHPNGALGLVEVVGMAGDLGALAEGWAVMGGRVERDDDAVVVRSAGTADLRFLERDTFLARYGLGADPTAPVPALAVASVRVVDEAAAKALLQANGVPFETRFGGRVVAPAVPELGLTLEFVQG